MHVRLAGMMVALCSAALLDGGTVSAHAESFRPRNLKASYNREEAFFCRSLGDAQKFLNLWSNGAQRAATKMADCRMVKVHTEMIFAEESGDWHKFTLVLDNDDTVDGWTRKGMFLSHNDWLTDDCLKTITSEIHLGGLSPIVFCADAVSAGKFSDAGWQIRLQTRDESSPAENPPKPAVDGPRRVKTVPVKPAP